MSEIQVPDGKRTTTRLVALIGLHIAKKTPKLDQWMWATFEHVDNAPVDGTVPGKRRYSLYDSRRPAGYKPSWSSPPDRYGKPPTPRNRPVQVLRQADVDIGEQAKVVNAYMVEQMPKDSVWRNYQLVNVQWPMKPSKLDTKLTRPAKDGDPRPRIVANVTMETYMQERNSGGGAGASVSNDEGVTEVPPKDKGKSSCIGCHRLSAITPSFGRDKHWWYTDMSTIFNLAK